MTLVLQVSAYGWGTTNYLEAAPKDYDGESYSQFGLEGARMGGRAKGRLIDDCIGGLSLGCNVAHMHSANLSCSDLSASAYTYGSFSSGDNVIRAIKQFKAINKAMAKKLPEGAKKFGCIVREILALIDVLGIKEVHFVPTNISKDGTSWITEKLVLTDTIEIFSELNRHFNDAVDASI